jgi:hypothetical protein
MNHFESFPTTYNISVGLEWETFTMIHYQITTPEKAAVSIDGFIASIETLIKNMYIVKTDADDKSMGVNRVSCSVVKLITVLQKKGHIQTEWQFVNNSIKGPIFLILQDILKVKYGLERQYIKSP